KKNKWPPSRIGIGSKFKIPRLMLKIAMSQITLDMPCCACSPDTLAIINGPPRCLEEISPVRSLYRPMTVSSHHFHVALSPSQGARKIEVLFNKVPPPASLIPMRPIDWVLPSGVVMVSASGVRLTES